jgi:hypothetical protein
MNMIFTSLTKITFWPTFPCLIKTGHTLTETTCPLNPYFILLPSL